MFNKVELITRAWNKVVYNLIIYASLVTNKKIF